MARNGRDWHTLLEFCALVGSLIIDEEGVYDPRLPNDRLLLGMKGTLSEMELSTFRQRSREAIRLKAIRGELFQRVAIGFRVEPGCQTREGARPTGANRYQSRIPKVSGIRECAPGSHLAASGRRRTAQRRA